MRYSRKLIVQLLAIAVLSVSFGGFFSLAEVNAASPYVNTKSIIMKAGQTHTLKVTGAKNIKWKSSNKSVVKVSKKGKITAKKPGTATVTAKAKGKIYKTAVTVSNGKNKALIIYFSGKGHTKKAAQKIRSVTGADIIRLQPRKAYTNADQNYNKDCRANRDQETNSKPAIATTIKNLSQYDVIYLGYPIWWGKEPGVIRTFLTKTSLADKTVVPFCTSGGSGISGSMSHIKKLAKDATVKSGKDLSDASKTDINEWLKKLGTLKKQETKPTEPETPAIEPDTPATEPVTTEGKTLVIYFSATGTTKGVAEAVAKVTGADTYEIIAAEPYFDADLNWNDNSSRTTKEQNDSSARPEIASEKIDLSAYSAIYIGYSIWHGQAPKIMYTLVEKYDFGNKTVIPFCTSGSSPIGSSATNLKNAAKGGTWLPGNRFAAGASEANIKDWIDGLNL